MVDSQNIKWVLQGERFSKLLDALELTQSKAAEIVGTKQPSISGSIKGKHGIPEKWIFRLAEKYSKINRDWVYTGEGEMLKSENKQEYKYLIFEDPAQYLPSKDLSRKELERMVVHLWYRVGELEAWRREMEGRVEVGEGKGGKKK